ncbi:MAG: transcription elongation factor GreB [Sphingomonadaceae bacterium]|nr:transcription elongation factor GreB [Sphingomonadaceae bacterium]
MADTPNYITPAGMKALVEAHRALFEVERPKIVEIVSWAAGNGDRSENGDYLYGRKRLREIDRELTRLSKRLKNARVIDPAKQPDKSRVFFGATVTVADEDDRQRTITIVGEDETDTARGHISWRAPLAAALKGAAIGDLRSVRLPGGVQELEVVSIAYPSS